MSKEQEVKKDIRALLDSNNSISVIEAISKKMNNPDYFKEVEEHYIFSKNSKIIAKNIKEYLDMTFKKDKKIILSKLDDFILQLIEKITYVSTSMLEGNYENQAEMDNLKKIKDRLDISFREISNFKKNVSEARSLEHFRDILLEETEKFSSRNFNGEFEELVIKLCESNKDIVDIKEQISKILQEKRQALSLRIFNSKGSTEEKEKELARIINKIKHTRDAKNKKTLLNKLVFSSGEYFNNSIEEILKEQEKPLNHIDNFLKAQKDTGEILKNILLKDNLEKTNNNVIKALEKEKEKAKEKNKAAKMSDIESIVKEFQDIEKGREKLLKLFYNITYRDNNANKHYKLLSARSIAIIKQESDYLLKYSDQFKKDWNNLLSLRLEEDFNLAIKTEIKSLEKNKSNKNNYYLSLLREFEKEIKEKINKPSSSKIDRDIVVLKIIENIIKIKNKFLKSKSISNDFSQEFKNRINKLEKFTKKYCVDYYDKISKKTKAKHLKEIPCLEKFLCEVFFEKNKKITNKDIFPKDKEFESSFRHNLGNIYKLLTQPGDKKASEIKLELMNNLLHMNYLIKDTGESSIKIKSLIEEAIKNIVYKDYSAELLNIKEETLKVLKEDPQNKYEDPIKDIFENPNTCLAAKKDGLKDILSKLPEKEFAKVNNMICNYEVKGFLAEIFVELYKEQIFLEKNNLCSKYKEDLVKTRESVMLLIKKKELDFENVAKNVESFKKNIERHKDTSYDLKIRLNKFINLFINVLNYIKKSSKTKLKYTGINKRKLFSDLHKKTDTYNKLNRKL